MTASVDDASYALRSAEVRAHRREMLSAPHNVGLERCIDQIRDTRPSRVHVPSFDPCDGGVGRKARTVGKDHVAGRGVGAIFQIPRATDQRMPRLTTKARRTRGALALAVTLVVAVAAQGPEEYVIDAASTSMTIHVRRAGVFSFAGHEHEVAVPVVQGRIALERSDVTRSSINAEFDATALRVTGRGEPPEDVPEVQRVMLSDRVLDVGRYPTIAFHSRRVSLVGQSGDRMELRVGGDLTLHGTTRPVTVPVRIVMAGDLLTAEGTATVRQTDFGIQPVTAGAGTVKVKDEIDVVFSITARRP
jgi:polyisoprenoid-binding protein YceI